MTRCSFVVWFSVGLAAIGATVGCPPRGVRRTSAGAGAGSQATDPFSVAGMTAAILELDAARGTDAIKPLQARYEKWFKADPKNPFKRFLWAYALDDRNQAWQELVKVTKLNADFYWTYLGMGVVLDEWKVYDQAERNFATAVGLEPDFALGHARFGRMHLNKGDYAKAVELLSKAVELSPEVADYHLDLGRSLAKAGRGSEAVSVYRKVIVKRPESFAAHAELAKAMQALGNRAEAEKGYARAAELNAESYEVRFARGGLLQELSRDEEAVEVYRDACRVEPDALECWQALAALGAKLEREALQIQAYEQVVRIDEENVEAHAFLAPTYLKQEAIEKALPSYQLVLSKQKDNLEALAGLAEIYEKGEEFSKAMEFNRRVLEKRPGHASAKGAMERLFKRFHILAEPIGGKTPERVFASNRRQIAAVYKERLKKRPAMKGDLLLKVAVDDKGQVGEVSLVKNTVGDQVLELCAVWNLRRSRFPAGFGATYDFALTLRPGSD